MEKYRKMCNRKKFTIKFYIIVKTLANHINFQSKGLVTDIIMYENMGH